MTTRGGRLHDVAHGKEASDVTGKVRASYLEKVGDPATYVRHAAKLDRDRLMSTVGIGS